jgi:hypothetical protein
MNSRVSISHELSIARTQAWMLHALIHSDLPFDEFVSRTGTHETSRAEALRWRNGDRAVFPKTVQSVERVLPGTRAPFDLACFPLLDPRPRSAAAIGRIVNAYIVERDGEHIVWKFPSRNSLSLQSMETWSPQGDEFEDLVERADIHAFTALLAIFRLAEAMGNGGLQLCSYQAIYRMLPAIEGIPWLWPLRKKLRSCVRAMGFEGLWDGPGFIVDEHVLDTLSLHWHEEGDNFHTEWKAMKWDSGMNDPVVVFDAVLRRPIFRSRSACDVLSCD